MKLVKIHAGCVHDARVLRNSTLYKEAEAGKLAFVDKYELASNAYSPRTWFTIQILPLRRSVVTRGCQDRSWYVKARNLNLLLKKYYYAEYFPLANDFIKKTNFIF